MRWFRPALRFLYALPLVLVVAAPALADPPSSARQAPLGEYLSQPDETYGWTVRYRQQTGQTECVELILQSQTWRGFAWKHRLLVARPLKPAIPGQAVLIIGGGSWKERYQQPAEKLSRDFNYLIHLSNTYQLPVALLLQVPQQPLFDRKEDALIAYTFDQYLQTKEADWPLLLPMTKSAVRALDALQELAASDWEQPLEHFVVTGGSKRGWTTWLLAAHDERVNGLAPMVIDMLGMEQHLAHQLDSWGRFSQMIDDYTELDLPKRLESEGGKQLLEIVDPLTYVDRLQAPKLIMLGTNDPYWPVDSLNLYWDQLGGDKYVLNVANQGHGLNDWERMVPTLKAFTYAAAGQLELPQPDWTSRPDARGTTLELEGPLPTRVLLWSASSPTRDFREAIWTSVELDPDTDQLRRLRSPWWHTAFFCELVYEQGGHTIHLTTQIQMLPPVGR